MRSSQLTSTIIATVIAAASLAQAESTESMLTCTPGSDPDWTTQGNNYGRTNSTTASISNLCGLQVAWSHDFFRDVQTIQPIIAGDNILVTSWDSLHCFDKATGTPLWSFGGFPYIVGDLRGSPTVAGGAVYVGGGGAQSFTKVDLATGAVLWSRNLGGGGDIPLLPGQTIWTPSVVSGGFVYFTQETGNVYKLDDATGADLAGSPLALPDAPGAVPFNALTSDGTKLWVGTADAVGTAGNIHQIDMATMNLDWTLNNPGIKFWGPGDVGTFEPFNPEGFPGSMAYEDGILYYHSQIRNDANGFLHFPQTGGVGAIDVVTEDGTGIGILWVNDADATTLASPGLGPITSSNFSGPALGPGMVYTTSRGFTFGTEQDGVSAWDKSLGTRVWYRGYDTPIGQSKGVTIFEDIRSDAPATVFCQPDGTPYVFTGHIGGQWRLSNGNTGEVVWYRTFTDRVRSTAVSDDCVVTVTREGGPDAGGGAVAVFTVGPDRPRLQIDSQFVSRTIFTGDGPQTTTILDAISNTGCIDLNISAFTINAAADPNFLTGISGPASLAPGESGDITITYDVAGLSPYFDYTNNIEIVSDDPDYYPQDPTGAVLGNPTIEVNLVVGCWESSDSLHLGLGSEWVSNDGSLTTAVALGDDEDGRPYYSRFGDGFNLNGNQYHFRGSMWIAAQDNQHWAMGKMGHLFSPGPARYPSEFAPVEPCGLTITASTVSNPLGILDSYQTIGYNMADVGSDLGYFTEGSRQCFGVLLDIQRVGSTDAAFGDFGLVRVNITNEADGQGDISDLYFGVAQDWDIGNGGGNNTNINLADGSYSCDNGADEGRAAATAACGNARLDAPAVGTAAMGSKGSPEAHLNDFYDANAAFHIASDPYNYVENTYGPGEQVQNTDVGVYMSIAHIPFLAEDSSEEFYYCTWQLDNGINGLPWSDSASYDAAVAEIVCRAKAYAGFGKGDINCDGVVGLTDVVLLGNILDGLTAPTGGGIYTADVDADLDYDEDDYDLLFDVVGGVQPASAMGNAWRF